MLFTFALLPSVLYAMRSKNIRIGTNKPLGLFWGFVSGLIAAAGNIAFYLALENGADTSVAIPLTNIYPFDQHLSFGHDLYRLFLVPRTTKLDPGFRQFACDIGDHSAEW